MILRMNYIYNILILIMLLPAQSLFASTEKSTPPLKQSLIWKNWTGNFQYKPTVKDDLYYFTPTTRAELKEIILNAASAKGKIKLHVSGQRHSATPIVLNNMDKAGTPALRIPTSDERPVQWIIDLSCYHDLGDDGKKNMTISPAEKTVTVNAGVREDELDAYVTANNFMLKTVTAGGFFSIGGMSAVDVHGATVNESNFPSTIKSFTVMMPNGEVKTIDENSAVFNGFNELQFHRVSLGTLGVITSVTIRLEPRPYKTTLVGSQSLYTVNSQSDFINLYQKLLFSSNQSRVESFYNPYYTLLNIRALKWDVDKNPLSKKANDSYDPNSYRNACMIAKDQDWGAPLLAVGEDLAEQLGIYTQDHSAILTNAGVMISFAFENIRDKMQTAIENHSAMWLTSAARVTFMSYAIPLPDNNVKGLDVAWKALNVVNEVSKIMKDRPDRFAVSAPVEFRFLRGDDALLSATYSKNPNQRYVAIEIIGFTKKGQGEYQQNLLNFFANVECRWLKMGGKPHQGKMYGFYNPDISNACNNVIGTSPYNAKFLSHLQMENNQTQDRITAFKNYQHQVDQYGSFCNQYAAKLGIC